MNLHPLSAPALAEDDPRWAAVCDRDRSADGAFFYSVRTTGVYCRPSCAARRPLYANVRFHATAAAAEADGFRPCLRCRPDAAPEADHRAAIVRAACRRIETADRALPLTDLARAGGLSPFHFHRLFKAKTGVTPGQYAKAKRRTKVCDRLSGGRTVTEAIYESGFAASSRFYEKSERMLGMAPRAYKTGGAGVEIHFAIGASSLGAILVAATAKGVCAISLGDDPDALLRDLQDRFKAALLIGADPTFEAAVARVAGSVEEPRRGLDLPLDIRGTAFQLRVWLALQAIPAGGTASYAEIARRIGAPQAVRAVAGACAANPVALAIPCHRVIRSDGALGGYRWGVERKRTLLSRETGPLERSRSQRVNAGEQPG